ncbi:hypothetical protein RHECNPAF_1760057 [Rhizobium etli CNPAF512]|nr:hypothetical protein RHECNPAF_1760057 [Rhizobium etli CNPAF512]
MTKLCHNVAGIRRQIDAQVTFNRSLTFPRNFCVDIRRRPLDLDQIATQILINY